MKNIINKIKNLPFEYGIIATTMLLITALNKNFVYLNVSNLYITETICIIIMLSYFAKHGIKHSICQFFHKDYIPFALILTIAIFSLLKNDISFTAIRQSMIALYFVLFIIIFQYSIKKAEQAYNIIFFIVLISTFINALKLLYFKYSNIYLNPDEMDRVMHSEVDIIGAAFSLIYIIVYFKKTNKINSVLIITLNLLIIFLTARRTAMLGVSLAAIVYILLYIKKINIKKLILAFLATASLLLTFSGIYILINPEAGNEYADLLINKFSFTSEKNATWRLEAWGIAWSKFMSNPMYGIGFGTLILDEPMRNVDTIDPHNSYLSFIARMGIIGGIALLYLYAQTTILYLKELKNNISESNKNTLTLFFLLFVFGSFYAFVNVALENQYQGIYIFFAISYIYAYRHNKRNPEQHKSQNTKSINIIITILLLLYAGACFSPNNFQKSFVLYDYKSYPRIPNIITDTTKSTHPVYAEKTKKGILLISEKHTSNMCNNTCFQWNIPNNLNKTKEPYTQYSLKINFLKIPKNEFAVSLIVHDSINFTQNIHPADSIYFIHLNSFTKNTYDNKDLSYIGIDLPIHSKKEQLYISSILIVHNSTIPSQP